jgi:glycosyltransferase involved in cell wall biosynthesis
MAPFLSVVIPVYNDPGGLETTLSSLVRQTFSRERFEIVVVDNASADRTRSVATAFAGRNPDLVRVADETEVQSSYAARNRGVETADGEVLFFLDADMTAPPGLLEVARGAMRNNGASYVAGRMEVQTRARTPAALYDLLYSFPVERFLNRSQFAPTGCLLVHRRVFEKVGLFDERLESGGDFEFGRRVYDAGIRQDFASDLRMIHPARTSFASLAAKYARMGRGLAQLRHYHGQRFQGVLPSPASLRSLAPRGPLHVARRLRAHDIEIGLGTTIQIGLLRSALAFVRLRSFFAEHRRLDRQESGSEGGS